jgi:cytochrome P450
VTLLLAGHETTANALNWLFAAIATHPEVESKLHAELDSVLGGRLPTMADLAQLPYTERVLSESLRLWPPGWAVGRQAAHDVTVAGMRIPKGTLVFMSPYVMHRDPRYFPDPERFDPDRWTPEFKAGLPKFAYFPFSGGARGCIGEPFAWMEAVLIVATLAQRWTMRLAPGHQMVAEPLVTLRPKFGVKMVVTQR